MATVTVPSPSDASLQEAKKTVQRWAQTGASDEEKQQFLEEVIKKLGEPGTADDIEKALEDLGHSMVQSGQNFSSALDGIKAFQNVIGEILFPDMTTFQQQWAGYVSSWQTNVTTSENFAKQNAAEYNDYTLQLQRVDTITSKEEMQKLAADLKEFAKNNPVDIPVSFKDAFLNLKRDMETFQTKINTYLVNQLVEWTDIVQKDEDFIEGLKREIEDLENQIREASSSLAIASWWSLLAMPFPNIALEILMTQLGSDQAELLYGQISLKAHQVTQTALGELKAQFVALAVDFDNVGLLVDLWNTFHNDALDFAVEFENVETPSDLPVIYKKRVKLALAISIPLVKGLNAYAAIINQ